MTKKMFITSLVAVIIIFSGALAFSKFNQQSSSTGPENSQKTATIYKSPSCGCCVGYIAHLRSKGYDVEVIETNNILAIKNQYQIPRDMQSCHTAIIDGYVVEGHVPIEAVNAMLENQPDIDGIALPKMPAGSPGMPGIKRGQFNIYALKNGISSNFMSL